LTVPESVARAATIDGVVAAADVGGTSIKASLVSRDGAELISAQVPTPATDGPAAIVDRVAAVVHDIAESAGLRPLALGVAVCGVVDESAGVAVRAANLGWKRTPIRDLLAESTGLPVTVVHDVRAGGLAELRIGAASGSASALFVAAGTGIAAALLSGGAVDPGAHNLAGEIGHIVVAPDGRPCGCGAIGCLETIASAAAIARSYADATGTDGVDAATVVARAIDGDPAALAVWQGATRSLGAVLATCQSVLDPETVVIGGGLARAGDFLLGPLDEAIRSSLTFQHPPVLAVGALGDRAGCVGAGLAAWDALASPAGEHAGRAAT